MDNFEKQLWTAARSEHSTEFTVIPVNQTPITDIWIECGTETFDNPELAREYAKKLTKKGNCAQWEFARLARKFAKELYDLAYNSNFFDPKRANSTRDSIMAMSNMARAMANEMVK